MKIANTISAFIATASICWFGMAFAYEVSTHAGMTNATYGKSILSVGSTYDRLGLTIVAQKSLGKIYLDLADANLINPRAGLQFELDKLPFGFVIPDDQQFGTRAWLMRGAIREDDTSTFVSYIPGGGNTPQDDPNGNINRFCNHFFDPVNVRALSKFCFNSTLDMSPNWAIGTTDAFASPVQRQSFIATISRYLVRAKRCGAH